MARPGNALDARSIVAREIERRSETRRRRGERATLTFGTASVDCTVLDVSPGGAQVRLGSAAIVPTQVILHFQQGDAFAARRLWTLKDQIGLLFDNAAPLIQGNVPVAAAALDALPADGLDGCLGILRAAGFLDNFGLSEAAREAEAAYARLRDVLGGLVERRA
jgi:hypothetical protein